MMAKMNIEYNSEDYVTTQTKTDKGWEFRVLEPDGKLLFYGVSEKRLTPKRYGIMIQAYFDAVAERLQRKKTVKMISVGLVVLAIIGLATVLYFIFNAIL